MAVKILVIPPIKMVSSVIIAGNKLKNKTPRIPKPKAESNVTPIDLQAVTKEYISPNPALSSNFLLKAESFEWQNKPKDVYEGSDG